MPGRARCWRSTSASCSAAHRSAAKAGTLEAGPAALHRQGAPAASPQWSSTMAPELSERPAPFKNPFRPGAGHMPPYLAGREAENREFRKLLAQSTILENLVLT